MEKVGSKINIKTEQKILTELNHPSIVKIFDVAEDNRNIYLIEEYIDGCTLGDVLYKQDKYGRKVGLTAVDEEVVIEWAKQIAEALNYLHTRTPHPIIYRDLKLGNIMLDSNGKIKIIDFGIAKADTKDNSNDNNNGLTYLFAAPEQKQSGIANVKTDIYSFGVVLYILALGNKAKITKIYNERAKREVNQLIVEDIRELNPNLSVGLSMIIRKCLEEQPSKRYESIKE
ncbi:serine/threonine-protein kinase [uncultured Clostridium sp.]|uniref:serine/threonine-protein kinase n=1 Tax=uncultured Clostridium sp. TaxID=59620 RepID=UPI00345591A1